MADRTSEQTILEKSFDPTYEVLSIQGYGFDGSSLQRVISDAVAQKITVSGDYTYIAIAPPGTAQATAGWQAKRIDESVAGTTVFTWADGDANFDNTATDLTALSYS